MCHGIGWLDESCVLVRFLLNIWVCTHRLLHLSGPDGGGKLLTTGGSYWQRLITRETARISDSCHSTETQLSENNHVHITPQKAQGMSLEKRGMGRVQGHR